MFIEHVNLSVGDLERSVAFYRDVFGYNVRWEGTTRDGQKAAHVGDDRSYVALFQAGSDTPVDRDYDRVGMNHFGFVVDDLVAMKRRLADRGITPIMEADYDPGERLYFLDPDGIEVELVSYNGQKDGQ